MWETFVFSVPRLAERFTEERSLARWLLYYEREKVLKLTFHERQGRIRASFLIDDVPFRYIVYDLFRETVTFYVSSEFSTYTPVAARYILKEQKIPYEMNEMTLFVRPRQDVDERK